MAAHRHRNAAVVMSTAPQLVTVSCARTFSAQLVLAQVTQVLWEIYRPCDLCSASVVVGHGPKGMVDPDISQSRAVSQPGREINMAAFDGNVSFTSWHFNVLSVPSATYI